MKTKLALSDPDEALAVTGPSQPALRRMQLNAEAPSETPSLRPCAGRNRHAFTLIELLVVIAIITILAAMLLPTLAKSKAAGHSVCCLSNLGQLQKAYLMYVDDYADRLPPNGARSSESLPGSWVVGNAQLDTNVTNIQAGVLFPLVRSALVDRCPADRSTVIGRSLLRSRSYSLDMWLNGANDNGNGWSWGPANYPWSQVHLSTIRNPGPSDVFGFTDEQEQSITHGLFIIEQPARVIFDSGTDTWWSLAADRHRQGCNLSFLDGHVEHWRWKAPKIYRSGYPLATPGGDLEDHRKLQEHVPNDVLRQPPGW